MDDVTRRREFRTLLPFYINGTLDETQTKMMEEYLAAHPRAKDEYLFAKRLAEAANLPIERRDPMAGYDIIKARIDARLAEGTPSLFSRWREQFRAWGFTPALTLTLAFCSVQLVLSGAIVLPAQKPEVNLTRGVATAQQRVHLKVSIKRNAAYGDVVALLTRERCHIVWGPTPSGELWLALDEPRDVPRVRQALAQSALVEDVLEIQQP
ncbi:hypothetical protein [Pseudoduganella sp.]|uniref:hypothetical protein n=1 Tax=Pseudoduganella sp. TaxID=1880898 RepID=UPI0035B16BFB